MKTLVIGGGGREHALVGAISRDEAVRELHVAPANAGIESDLLAWAAADSARRAAVHRVDVLDPSAVVGLAGACGLGGDDLVVIGPEGPLVAGVADAVRDAGIPCFGPSAAAAQLEGSKSFAKDVMTAAGVPTAKAWTCTNTDDVLAAFAEFGSPYVVKDDGLAGGKGVVVTSNIEEALLHAHDCLMRPSGAVVVEEYLDGPEVSLFAICDGKALRPLLPAQDFKRAYDGDQGPNTGGMGAYAPLPWVPETLVDEVTRTVLRPTLDEMARRGTPFIGLLYAGLALTRAGVRVIEFNARFGDPETQVVLALLETPFARLLHAAATAKLDDHPALQWKSAAAVTVVVAANGYPSQPRMGDRIDGLQHAGAVDGVVVHHAGTRRDGELLVADGGRVLAVTAVGDDFPAARSRAYEAVEHVSLDGSHYRRDIAAEFPTL